jgi:hypothetical protein
LFPANQPVRIYRLRVALLRTSPHLWRRILVRSSCSLSDLHHTIPCRFGLSANHPYQFLIRGRSSSDNNATTNLPLSELEFAAGERFLYDVRFQDARALMPVWRHQVRQEKIITAGPSDSFPRCIEGRGSPPLEQVSGPVELAYLAELFTPRSVVHRLAELMDGHVVDGRLAQELRHLRPWLNLRTFSANEANRRVRQETGRRP